MENISTKKISTFTGVVVKAIKETPDTWTLHIFVGNEKNHYKAGQFVSINPNQFNILSDFVKYLEYVKQKREVVRAYSLASAPHEKYISITIKPEYYDPKMDSFPPLLSPLLASDLLLGKEIELLGYSGAYVMPDDLSNIDEVIHLVAGSGIVPSFSIIKDVLYKKDHPKIKHKLLYVNKKYEDIIYHDELKKLERDNSENLETIYYLTKESFSTEKNKYILGRPSIDNVRSIVKDESKALFFACGPAVTKWQRRYAEKNNTPLTPRFMEWVSEVIDVLKVDKKRYKKEVYG